MKTLGNRMKEYENCSRITLTRRMPTIIRIDGKAFHTYTKGFEKPWDLYIMESFSYAALTLFTNIQGCKFAYIQSDEISLLLTDYESLETEPWFGKGLQKMVSVSASICTAAFNEFMKDSFTDKDRGKTALFDARAFSVPKEDVCNYFLWRQQDAIRNSIQGLAQANFSHKSLHGLNTSKLKEKLLAEKDIDWNELPAYKKHGWGVVKRQDASEIGQAEAPDIVRAKAVVDRDIPNFGENRFFIESML
jgi:tRNA(His) 5'-end guanylyltransferase